NTGVVVPIGVFPTRAEHSQKEVKMNQSTSIWIIQIAVIRRDMSYWGKLREGLTVAGLDIVAFDL
ncbi:MAG: hypothetical protein ACJ73D_04460, partial [Pyrinomonadaceae bacterium]